jgi:hypothetical protein
MQEQRLQQDKWRERVGGHRPPLQELPLPQFLPNEPIPHLCDLRVFVVQPRKLRNEAISKAGFVATDETRIFTEKNLRNEPKRQIDPLLFATWRLCVRIPPHLDLRAFLPNEANRLFRRFHAGRTEVRAPRRKLPNEPMAWRFEVWSPAFRRPRLDEREPATDFNDL